MEFKKFENRKLEKSVIEAKVIKVNPYKQHGAYYTVVAQTADDKDIYLSVYLDNKDAVLARGVVYEFTGVVKTVAKTFINKAGVTVTNNQHSIRYVEKIAQVNENSDNKVIGSK